MRRASPPPEGMTKIWPAPMVALDSSGPFSVKKAIHLPSGENRGR